MRIIAGRFKGRRLIAPKGAAIRPTSDSLRETLFNVLGDLQPDARVLDAYAGTGALGLEALSRGAAHVTFVERDRAALDAITRNVDALGARNACAIIRADFAATDERSMGRAIADRADPSATIGGTTPPFDLVLLDPPYEDSDLAAIVARGARLVAAAGTLVLEHGRRRETPASVPGLRRIRVLTAGDSALSFYVAVS